MASDTPSSPPRFFVLEKLRGGQHDMEFGKVDANRGPPLHCPQCGGHVGMLTWLPPYRVELELHGKDYGDLVEGPGGSLLVTERFAEDFKAEELTGLSDFQPVEVVRVRRMRRGPKPDPSPRYLFVTPSYGHAALDMERSRILSSKPVQCTWCRKIAPEAIDGLALEAGTWNGEDVFRPRGLWSEILVTERFMRFAEKHALSHLTWVPIEKYVWDPLGRFYPHLLQPEPPARS